MIDKVTLRQLIYTDEWMGDIIYFVGSSESHKVKIGKTSNTQFTSRLGELQISSPDKLIVLGIIKGGTRKEADLHKKFIRSHHRGEWFELTDDITSYIESEATELVYHKKHGTSKPISMNHTGSKRKMHKYNQEFHLIPVIWCDVCNCWHDLKRERQFEWPPGHCVKWGK